MNRFVTVAALLALLATPGLASCSPGPREADEPARSTGPVSSPAAQPAAQLGQTLDLARIGAQRVAVTITRIINPATVPNGWGDPGSTYIAAQLTIKNTGTTAIVGNSNSDVSIIGSDNTDYHADFATVIECRDFTYGWFLIPVGGLTEGCVVFKLPPDVRPEKVKYTPSSGVSRDYGVWLIS